MKGAYYNEFDPFAAEWLRELINKNLIAEGDVDTRPIQEVMPDDLKGYIQCHFFAGIGGWSRALRLAGWEDSRPAWTGSCPCQPFSAAGKQKGHEDERHLWPEWFRLIRESRPPVLFGEQVEAAIRHGWLDLVSGELEGEGYAIGATVLGAHSVGSPHIRQRLWFVADTQGERGDGRSEKVNSPATGSQGGYLHQSIRSSEIFDLLVDSGLFGQTEPELKAMGGEQFCETDLLGNTERPEKERLGEHGREVLSIKEAKGSGLPSISNVWSDCGWIWCRDGKFRPVESAPVGVADGIPDGMGLVCYGDRFIVPPLLQKGKNRVGRLRGYGNAIVPQVAAEFIQSYMECRSMMMPVDGNGIEG